MLMLMSLLLWGIVDRVYHSRMVTFMGYKTWTDLVILDMVDFDVILWMSWLSLYHAILDCDAKTVSISIPGMCRLEFEENYNLTSKKIIFYNRAKKLAERGI